MFASYDYPGPRLNVPIILGTKGAVHQLYSNNVGLSGYFDYVQSHTLTKSGYCPPLLTYGALANPKRLAERLGRFAEGTMIIPAFLGSGAKVGWAVGGRYTLVTATATVVEPTWVTLIPWHPEVGRILDRVEGRDDFYTLSRLTDAKVTTIHGIIVNNPLTYIGGRFRLPVEKFARVARHTVVHRSLGIHQLGVAAGGEQQLVNWATSTVQQPTRKQVGKR